MARQRIHNRRAARGSVGGGASWISYSDMMAALVLIFVLILTYSLSHYFSMLEEKNHLLSMSLEELEAKDLQLRQSMHELGHATQELDLKTRDLNLKTKELDQAKTDLEEKELLLLEQQDQLIVMRDVLNAKESELASSRSELEAAQLRLAEQQQAMQLQAARIDSLAGLRRTMISDLSATFAQAGIDANVDDKGNIVLNSSVFFEVNQSTIRAEGQALLNRFIPVYLSVLLRDEYADYLGEIIIEGHTDSTGTYEKNLKLSQERALQVALYCLNMDSLSVEQKDMLKQILTAKGRSNSDPILVKGVEDKDASRRVEFKFSLKDDQLIDEMNQILKQQNLGNE